MAVERLPQRFSLHDLRVKRGAGFDRADRASEAVFIDMNHQFQPQARRGCIAESDHVAEFPCGVDVKQWKRQLRRMEGLASKVQENA